MKHPLLLLLIIPSFLASCDFWGNSPASLATDSVNVCFNDSDTVYFGYAGMECSDSILDFIVPGQDPVKYNIIEARKRGNITGAFVNGDRIAIQLSRDGKEVEFALDLSSLIGSWTKKYVESDTDSVRFMLSQDGSAASLSRTKDRKFLNKWDIKEGKLVITKSGFGTSVEKRKLYYDTLNIVSLSQDSMVLSNDTGRYVFQKYINKKR